MWGEEIFGKFYCYYCLTMISFPRFSPAGNVWTEDGVSLFFRENEKTKMDGFLGSAAQQACGPGACATEYGYGRLLFVPEGT
jgi:hypothetical protein